MSKKYKIDKNFNFCYFLHVQSEGVHLQCGDAVKGGREINAWDEWSNENKVIKLINNVRFKCIPTSKIKIKNLKEEGEEEEKWKKKL